MVPRGEGRGSRQSERTLNLRWTPVPSLCYTALAAEVTRYTHNQDPHILIGCIAARRKSSALSHKGSEELLPFRSDMYCPAGVHWHCRSSLASPKDCRSCMDDVQTGARAAVLCRVCHAHDASGVRRACKQPLDRTLEGLVAASASAACRAASATTRASGWRRSQ